MLSYKSASQAKAVAFAGTKQTSGLRSFVKPIGFTQVTKSHLLFVM